jgi:hypothetical protein
VDGTLLLVLLLLVVVVLLLLTRTAVAAAAAVCSSWSATGLVMWPLTGWISCLFGSSCGSTISPLLLARINSVTQPFGLCHSYGCLASSSCSRQQTSRCWQLAARCGC